MSDFSHTYDYFNKNLTSGCSVNYEDEKFRNTVPLDYLLWTTFRDNYSDDDYFVISELYKDDVNYWGCYLQNKILRGLDLVR